MASGDNSWQASVRPKARFLVVRRDNIGDLVCTTPLIRLLRERFPEGYIAALVNGYNKGVLSGNGDLDKIYQYSKTKHVRGERGVLDVWLERIKLIRRLRRERFDFVILANSGYQRSALHIAQFIGARHVVGYVPELQMSRIIDIPVRRNADEVLHEVDAVNRLLAPFGIEGKSSPGKLCPDERIVARMRSALGLANGARVVGVHISARTAEGRWSVENVSALIRKLVALRENPILLFWSPGDAMDARHPGDDHNAAKLLADCSGLPVRGCPTSEVEQLVAGLSLCDTVICCDGGAMHIAAALGKRVVALFGKDPARWHPWQTKHVVLRAPSGLASDITVDEVARAYERLCQPHPESDVRQPVLQAQ